MLLTRVQALPLTKDDSVESDASTRATSMDSPKFPTEGTAKDGQ